MDIVKVSHLKKNYGAIEAVKDVSFTVEKGQLFSFLGPNGAGKSTTIDMLCTLSVPDGGEAYIDGLQLGKDNKNIRQAIGIVFQDNLLDPLLTVKENLDMRAGFYYKNAARRKQAVADAAKIVELEELLPRFYGKLSGGQRRRVDIARALVNTPKLLFLDEPTTGLDPQTRSLVWDTILRLQQEQGMTIFLTTHYMEEADRSDSVVVIDHGQVVAWGTPASLKAQYVKDTLLLKGDTSGLCTILKNQNIIYEESGGGLLISLNSTLDAMPILERCRKELSSFEVHSGTMDDVFMGITGRDLREA